MVVRQAITVLFLFRLAIVAQDTATLTITVADPSDAVVPGAKVTLSDLNRGAVFEKETNETGAVLFDFLQPGDFSLDVEKPDFDKYHVDLVRLQVRDRQIVRLNLKLSSAAVTTVNVTAPGEGISSDVAQGVSVDHQYIQNLPANGRNAESLILFAPGVTSATSDGGFNANGLRTNTNYFTLDGVSLNQSSGGGGFGGGIGPGGPPPGGAGGGGATQMITIDAMQEMKVQTASFAPEFGRTPGAQVVMTSRGGSNSLHGSLYDYERNDRFDANNWFSNAAGYGRGWERQERPGGVIGGPIVHSKTFFFISFERLRLQSPQSIVADVPDAKARAAAPAALLPYLRAFPYPNGPELANDSAEYRAVVSNPSRNTSSSIRIDHTLNSTTTLFARYSLTPSTSESRGSQFAVPNIIMDQSSRSQLVTAGVTHVFADGILNDLRLNFSAMSGSGSSRMDSLGGAVPLTDSEIFPSGITSATGSFGLNIQGLAGYSFGGHSGNRQDQVNVIDSATRIIRNHHLKTGLDYRKQLQTMYRSPYNLNVSFDGVTGYDQSLLTGEALNVMVSSNLPSVYPTYMNLSLYGQDTWQATERTTVTYGLRWDLNPAPTTRKGPLPFALSNDNIAGVTQNQPLYPTRWDNVAPRFGVAYLSDNTPGREMMLRAGVGVFYDMGYGAVNGAFGGAPFSNVWTFSRINFPLAANYMTPPPLPPTRPYGQITTGGTGLVSPIVYQWNGTWEKNYGPGGTFSVGYTGNSGSNLMRTATQPTFSSAYEILRQVTNGASSDYYGVNIQYRRRFGSNFQSQLTYTWSHSMDTASNDFGGGFASLFGSGDRGPSDYDIRHNLNFSGSIRLPAPSSGFFYALRHWYLDFVFSTRTGLPFDILGVSSCTSSSSSSSSSSSTSSSSTCTSSSTNSGLFAQVRPNYVSGQAIWIVDHGVPGGKRINKAAFSIPSGYAQGDLARNSLRGFGFGQLDASLRRTIPVTERWQLNIALQAYNATNHPNFANPSPQEGANMASPNFGVMTQMLYQGFGGGGVNSLYRSGGPRSMELSVRLQF